VNAAEWLEFILPHLKVDSGPDERGEHVAWCPLHADGTGKPPHAPNLNVSVRGWYCHVCQKGGSLKQLIREMGIKPPGLSHRKGEGRVRTWYDYRDEQGNLLFQVGRKVPKGFTQRRPDGKGGWLYSLNRTRRVVYHLPELIGRPNETIWIVEGEKDADRLAALELVTTTNPMGAGKWLNEYSESFRGRDVVIVPDNDQPGLAHARNVAQDLKGTTRSIKIVRLSELPDKGDVSDWLNAGHTKDELIRLADETPIHETASDTPEHMVSVQTPSPGPRPQADQILDLAAEAGYELMHDRQGTAFARIRANGHWEAWPVGSSAVRSWLTLLFHNQHDRAPNLTALNTAVNALQARARFEGTTVELHNRVAWCNDAIYYDLCDAEWRAIRITSDGWEIDDSPPPLFRRYGHQLAQVTPMTGGNLKVLFEILPIKDSEMQMLVLAHLASALIPSISHPVLILHGPQGSSKTISSRVIRRLIDPSVAEAVSLPDKPEQLIQTLAHHWMPVFDNVSVLPRWVSDTLCRTATGEAFSKRTLYTDDDDFIWSFRRCPVINGINVAAVQPDLLDRSILIGLEPISSDQRRSEKEIWKQFDNQRPMLLGALFTALSAAMREKPNLLPCSLPRMADFAHWGMSIALATGTAPRAFLAAYDTNIGRQNAEVINAHPLASAVLNYALSRKAWSGQASDLLKELNAYASTVQIDIKDKLWPKQPNVLVRRLNELIVNLRATGLHVAIDRDKRGSRIELRLLNKTGDDGDGSVSVSSPISSPPNCLPFSEMERR
jgi:5S rRNA maturation endonuclease (ribonuclease M5)